jgi:hypothetical protein
LRALREVTTRRFAETVVASAHEKIYTPPRDFDRQKNPRVEQLVQRTQVLISPLRVLEKKLLDIGRTNRTMASYRKYGGRQSSTLIVENISIVELHCGS